jgi:hypothetical protein
MCGRERTAGALSEIRLVAIFSVSICRVMNLILTYQPGSYYLNMKREPCSLIASETRREPGDASRLTQF